MAEQLPLFSTPTAETLSHPEARASNAAAHPTALVASVSLRTAIVAWVEHLKEDAQLNTIKAFSGDLKLFAEFAGPGKSLNQLTTRDLNQWLQSQRASGRSPKTYARRVTSLKAFFRWLGQTGILANDPAAPVIQQTVLSPLPLFLSEAEVQHALAAAEALWKTADKPDIRPYLLFTLLLKTGIKKSECLSLELNHVDPSNPDEPVLWIRYTETRQRYKERKLKLDPTWLAVYEAYRAEYKPELKIFPYSPRRLEYLLEDITKAASLDKHLSFEMCRWTCAVRDAKAGLDEDKIRQKLGLSKIQWREIGMKLRRLAAPGL